MELFYLAVFLLSALAAAVLEGTRKTETGSAIANRDFLKFRNNYVLVYALMMGEAYSLTHPSQDVMVASTATLIQFALLTTCLICSWGLASRAICICLVPRV